MQPASQLVGAVREPPPPNHHQKLNDQGAIAPFAQRKGRERAKLCERGMPGAERGPTNQTTTPPSPQQRHPTLSSMQPAARRGRFQTCPANQTTTKSQESQFRHFANQHIRAIIKYEPVRDIAALTSADPPEPSSHRRMCQDRECENRQETRRRASRRDPRLRFPAPEQSLATHRTGSRVR